MKFKLFDRLRDSDDDDSGSSDFGGGGGLSDDSGGLGGGPGGGQQQQQDMSSGLDRNVERMFNQGYSEEEVRQELQGQYSPQEIDQAVNRAVTSSATGGGSSQPPQGGNNPGGPEPMSPYQGEDQSASPMDEGFDQNDNSGNLNAPAQQNQPQPAPPAGGGQQQQPPSGGQGGGAQANVDQSVEELVETIVAENFETVEEEFENVYGEIDDMRQELEGLEERVQELEIRDDEDQTQVVEKMGELEEDIDSYQARMGGLEKAFQQILPSLVDNVRELTQLVQEIKQEKGIETETNVSQDDIDDLDMEDWE